MSSSGGAGSGTSDNTSVISGSVSGTSGDKQTQQILQKSLGGGTTTFPINLAANKIGHVKPATIDTIKVATPIQTGLSGSGQMQQTSYRPVTTRVVMPTGTIVPGTMIKQINAAQVDNTGSGGNVRAQITAIPARTISQTSITVTRSVTPTTYIPRPGVNTATIQTTQRMSAPIRSSTPPTVANLATGTFVRGASVARNSSSPATTVISPTNATWMATGGQVQLIRTISHQPRQRLITQNITGNVSNPGGVVSASNAAAGIVAVGQVSGPSQGSSGSAQGIPSHQGSIQTSQQQQQTFVATLATVLPPRQQTATLVYSNVSNSQGQQYTSVTGGSAQRYTVATPITGSTQRQVRPIQLNNRAFSTATKLGTVSGMNTTSISIRAPNTIPVLTPTINTGNTGTNTIQGSSGNINLPTNSLTTTRIIQLQQQPGTGGQQLIGTAGQRITSNLIMQPIIMNTGGKLGIRTPATVNPKGSSSLTITQLGSLTKQSGANISGIQGATISQSAINQTGATVVASVAPSGTIVQQTAQSQQQSQSQQQNQPTSVSLSVSSNQQPITQIVSVNQALSGSTSSGQSGQIISTQNVPVSATVVPLAITSKGATNVFTGTLNPIKAGTGIAGSITKVISQSLQQQTQQQQQQHQANNSASVAEIITSQSGSGQHHQPTSVFIHARPPNSGSGASGGATVIPNSGTFLNSGTFYYESVPANSVTVSTGVLSLTTTTVTSTVSSSQPVTSISAGNISTSLPFSPSGNAGGGTFTVVPASAVTNIAGSIGSSTSASGSRAIGQIQIPVSGNLPVVSASATSNVNSSQIQAVPIRFSSQNISQHTIQSQQQQPQTLQHNTTSSAPSTLNEQVISTTVPSLSSAPHQQSQQNSSQAQHQIITMTTQQTHSGQLPSGNANQQTAHMIIPIQTSSIKLTGTSSATSSSVAQSNQRHITNSNTNSGPGNVVQAIANISSVNTAFLRKRDTEGSPIRAAKNLAPTLLSMGTSSAISSGSSPVSISSSTGSVVGLNVASSSNLSNTIQQNNSSSSTINLINQKEHQRAISPISRPGSSDGSTTVSANSSPGLDQQMNEELQPMNRISSESHFNPINEMYANHQNHIPSSITGMRRQQQQQQQLHQQQHQQQSHQQQHQQQHLQQQQQQTQSLHTDSIQISQAAVSNGNIEFTPPRKKSRRSTNDSQNSSVSHHQQLSSQSGHLPTQNNQTIANINNSVNANNGSIIGNIIQENANKVNNNVVNNKENAKPTDYIIKKPRTCNLLDTYKQNWKSANNHFQRYSDVKPREERRPTVMDLANQANVIQKINGWKIHHLSAQMEDLCEIEGQVYDKLSEMLKKFEIHGKNSELDRVSELIKGNMQRSKIISDGVNEARSQIMKIFEHKNHVSDIIHRCASKRNFKKREKP
ncbi:uncharacterized protein LOC129608588 isoform X2 [Condylostylus longicornis]|uniref:uncharacterized protein LOC129608588 isoform X2 n=1 Tax=Condylostylus longicornis TaxID=2530218 RepID=UPI00244DA9DF|nr:uncharacterized protein LOC129608588 isoform X2 [Condylostylus longicornis]